MISKEQYEYALRMLVILDMNLDDFLFDRYLNIALDYEVQSGCYCSTHLLDNAKVSKKQTTIAGRAAYPIRSIVTFDENPFYVIYVDKNKKVS